MARTSGTFGTVEQLSGGHYRARFTGPDGRRYKAPTTFLTKGDARGLAGTPAGRHHPQGLDTAGGHAHSRPQADVPGLRQRVARQPAGEG